MSKGRLHVFSKTSKCDISSDTEKIKYLKSWLRKQKGYKCITKFEKARVIGIRATEISNGAPVNVPLEGETDPIQIALKEFRENKIPYKLRRYYPDGIYVEYRLSELRDYN
mmetsp:Transcript_21272/g.29800  ORF Transcript_21272/g.29800 Transcript_21272/m.29800 type:complete len:111 (-) Transcript_21272:2525-2857(-)